MPFNTNFSDALNKALPRIPRVWFNRYSAQAEIAFVNALVQALQHDVELVYIASIKLEDIDRQAAQRIAWLRAKTFSLAKLPSHTDIVGALGEWAVLRDIGANKAVTAVSLVSLGPEPKPDFLVEDTDPATGTTTTIPFDIKTTASREQPFFFYDPARHRVKGDPHILGLRLSDTWEKADSADIYLTRADRLDSLEEGDGTPKRGSLNGNLQ